MKGDTRSLDSGSYTHPQIIRDFDSGGSGQITLEGFARMIQEGLGSDSCHGSLQFA